jgi:HPr kinase/phosphorylase
VLITGPSGSGKSGLGLQLLALGCELIADDITVLIEQGGKLVASSPKPPIGIEARYIGILGAPICPQAVLALEVDMGQVETDRLPPHRSVTYEDVELPLVHKCEHPHFAAAILHYMRFGRVA